MDPIGAAQQAPGAQAQAANGNQNNGVNDQANEAAEKFMTQLSLMVFNEVWKVGQENAQ